MREFARKPMPDCVKGQCDCFGRNENGHCRVLENTHFGGKPCAFYKSAARADADYEAAYDRLVDQGRYDLIQKYHVDAPVAVRRQRGLAHAACDSDLLMPIRVNAFEHQKNAFTFTLDQFQVLTRKPPISRGVALLMEMGTGKSLVALAVAGCLYQLGHVYRVLIVAPLSVLSVWEEEFTKFAAFPYSMAVLKGTTEKKKRQIEELPARGVQIVVVNYESAWRLEESLLKYDADLVICDEGHKLKEGRSRQSKGMHAIGDKARFRMLLTGTLITNRELDVWSQYRFLNQDVFGKSFYTFRNRYFYMTGYGNHTPVFRQSMTGDFLSRMHSIAFRVTKEECLDLPDFTDEIRTIDLEPEAQKLYRQIEQESYAELQKGEVTATNVLTRLLRLLQITGGHVTDDDGTTRTVSRAKLSALEDIIDTAQAEGQKLVIMARFTAELDEIEALLTQKDITFSSVRGGVKDRGDQVSRFQSDPGCTVFVGQIQAAGMGLTLTAASTMVFYSIDYSYATHDQCKARIHRAGQKNFCTYIYLCAKGTVDRRVIQALRDKQDLARALVDDYRMGRNPYRD